MEEFGTPLEATSFVTIFVGPFLDGGGMLLIMPFTEGAASLVLRGANGEYLNARFFERGIGLVDWVRKREDLSLPCRGEVEGERSSSSASSYRI